MTRRNRAARKLYVGTVVAVLIGLFGSVWVDLTRRSEAAAATLAAAGIEGLIPEWAYDAAESIHNGCGSLAEMPAEWLETGGDSARLAFVDPPSVGQGAATLTLAGTGAAAAGAAAGTGVAAATGTAGLAVATFVGVGCSTILAGDWLFGDPYEEFHGPSTWVATGGLESCVGTEVAAYAAGTDVCVTFTVPEGLDINRARISRGDYYSEGDYFSHGSYLDFRQPNGTLGTDPVSVSGGQTRTIAMPCQDITNNCGLIPPGYATFGAHHFDKEQFIGTVVQMWKQSAGFPRAVAPTDIDRLNMGRQRRMVATGECKRPSDGDLEPLSSTSATWWDNNPEASPPDMSCPTGYALVEITIDRQVAIGGAASPVDWQDESYPERRLLHWRMPTAVRSNAQALQCWVDGLTNCPIWEENPGDPQTVRKLGGAQGLVIPESAPKATETIDHVIAEAPWPEENPEPDPDPTTTTTAAPTTTVAPTTTTEPPEIIAPPEDIDPGEPGAACFPSGWGLLNPVEWVVKPLMCVFWDADTASEIAALGSEHGWTQLVTDSEVTTSAAAGPCIDMDVAEICTEPILSVEAPSAATGFFAAAVLFFGVFETVGLFARITAG